MMPIDTLKGLPADEKRSEARKVIVSSYLGSTIEYYDFLLYATAAATVFPTIFFSDLDPLAGAIASFGTFATGYIARPLGGAIFGHFGDRLGRKKMLVLSMLIMGLASTLIGIIPSSAQIGSWAAVLLVMMRVCQGIAVGGEWGGAALMALEHSEPRRRGFAASFTNAGAPTGAALGTFVLGTLSAVLTDEQFMAWGWRIAFLLSVILLVIGMVIRAQISESPIFAAAIAKEQSEGKKPRMPILQVLARPQALLLVMFGGAAAFATQVILPTFAVGFASSGGAGRSVALYSFSIASVISAFAVVGFARLSDRVGRRPIMIAGLVLYVLWMIPMFSMLESGESFMVFTAFTVALIIHGLVYGPLAAFVSEQFGTTARYTGASLGYQLATLLGAGFTPTVAAALFAGPGGGQSTGPVVLLIAGISIVSILAIVLTGETKDRDLQTHAH